MDCYQLTFRCRVCVLSQCYLQIARVSQLYCVVKLTSSPCE